MKRALHGSVSLYLGLLTLCCSQIAGAQELRHRDYFFGDRAMGLSGATTALATDPSSALYNPAGLPLGRDRTFTGSMIVLDQQSMTLTNGLRVHPESGVQRDLRSRASGLYPYSGEALSKLAEGHYLAIASFIPFNRTMQFSDRGLSLIEGKTHAALNRFYSRESRASRARCMGADCHLHGLWAWACFTADTSTTDRRRRAPLSPTNSTWRQRPGRCWASLGPFMIRAFSPVASQ